MGSLAVGGMDESYTITPNPRRGFSPTATSRIVTPVGSTALWPPFDFDCPFFRLHALLPIDRVNGLRAGVDVNAGRHTRGDVSGQYAHRVPTRRR